MKVFDHYAQYYDLLYSVKDYEAEANYVCALIDKFGTGVDVSAKMVALANQKKAQKGLQNISFEEGNILSLRLNREFDVVVSLFHVMNYLTKTSEMKTGFANAWHHVKPGGLFIFDTWYGPAVLSDLPKVGVRRFENDRIKGHPISGAGAPAESDCGRRELRNHCPRKRWHKRGVHQRNAPSPLFLRP